MKILVCGDKHLKITRFEKSKAFLEWLCAQIKETDPDIVVNLGDDMDTHAVLRSELMGEYKKYIEYVCETLNKKMYYIVGNHDGYKPNSIEYHAFQPFKSIHKNFIVVDKTIIDGDMTFVPYIYNHEDFPQINSEICFAHQTFIGADYGYHRPDVGVDAEKLNCSIIIAGHMHKRQTFGKVIYPGTPYAYNLNDVDQDKGIMIFDTETYKTEFIRSPFPRWRSIGFEINSNNTVQDLHGVLEAMLNDKDNWIIKLTGPKAEIMAYLRTKKYINLIKGKNVTPKLTLTDNLKKSVSIKSISMTSIVDEYIDKVYTGSIDKKELYDKALSIIESK